MGAIHIQLEAVLILHMAEISGIWISWMLWVLTSNCYMSWRCFLEIKFRCFVQTCTQRLEFRGMRICGWCLHFLLVGHWSQQLWPGPWRSTFYGIMRFEKSSRMIITRIFLAPASSVQCPWVSFFPYSRTWVISFVTVWNLCHHSSWIDGHMLYQ